MSSLKDIVQIIKTITTTQDISSLSNQILPDLITTFEKLSINDKHKISVPLYPITINILMQLISIKANNILSYTSTYINSLEILSKLHHTIVNNKATLILGENSINDNYYWKTIMILTNILELNKKTVSNDNSIMNADYEALSELCFKNIHDILSIWRIKYIHYYSAINTNIDNNDNNTVASSSPSSSLSTSSPALSFMHTYTQLQGPYLAQLIQTILYYLKHPSKTLVIYALYCLFELIHLYPHLSNDWQLFLPGVFSQLHVSCLQGYKRYDCINVHM